MENDFIELNDDIHAERVNYSIEDLEKFRTEDGFIDIRKTGVLFSAKSREIMGNMDRTKNWIDFAGKSALFKGETIMNDERNYSIYSELIIEELAKQAGIPTAHYDLAKYGDELGVLSISMLEKGENLTTLRDIIGDEVDPDDPESPITSLDYSLEKLQTVLKANNYSESEIESLINDYKKRTAFIIATLDQDKHTENFSFIKGANGKIRLAPSYDSECALLLDNSLSTSSKLLNNYFAIQDATTIAQPRIGNQLEVEDGGHNLIWADTIESLIDTDDEMYDYFNDVIMNLDISKVIEAVEERIHAKIPEDAAMLAKYAFESRQTDIMQVLDGRYYSQEEKDYIKEEKENSQSKSTGVSALDLINFFKSKEIRTSEQKQVSDKLFSDLDKSKESIPEEEKTTEEQGD